MSKQPEVPRARATSPAVHPSPRPAADSRVEHGGVAVGDLVGGKYRVEGFIGEGGVGFVAMAQNVELDERVALKLLRSEMLVQPEVVARFMREAKAACSMKSEYVANVYDVGLLPDGAPYLVMEYLEGADLGRVIEQRGPLEYREATEWVMQTCEALAVAHAKGVVHRDIKPENLFVTSRAGMSVIKVLDFGISKAALTGSIFGSAVPLVKTANLMGTPLYMSPEQVRNSESVDARSDIWSLGIVLYEMLTARHPLAATTLPEICAKILEVPLEPVSNHRRDLPAGYAEVLERCLAKDPAHRYPNVAELAIALMPFAPKRARICAERATQALRAAGLVAPDDGRFDSGFPPPSAVTSSNPSIPTSGAFPSSGSGPLWGSTPAPGSPPLPSFTPTAAFGPTPSDTAPSAPHSTLVNAARSDTAPSSRRGMAIGAALALLVVAAFAGVSAMRRSNDPAPPAAAAGTAPAAPAGAAEEVTIDISATPASAVIVIDGKRTSTNPTRLRVARGPGAHEVRAEAEGYLARSMTLGFDRDRSVDLALAPAAATAATTAPPPRRVIAPAGARPPVATAEPVASPTPAPAPAPSPKGITEIDASKHSTKHDAIDTDILKR